MSNPEKDKHAGLPVEHHLTAAWANTMQQKPVSNVTIPSMDGVTDAKDYVEENQK